MLKSILMVWVLAQNLGATQQAYEDYLGYTLVDEGVMPAEHTAQVQGNLWVTDRKWCDFMSFDPRMPTPETQAVVIRVLRDEEFIKKLAEKVAEFEIRLLALVKKLGGPFERN